MTTRSLRGTEEQGATFVELFFDLVFVFAVTQVTAVLAHDLTAGGVLEAAIIFWLVWWAWTQYTWSLNQADTEHASVRLFTLGATAVAFVMAISVPLVEEPSGWLFPVSYLVIRATGIWLQWRLIGGEQAFRGPVLTWTITSSVGLLAVVVAIALAPDQRFIALAVAALLDINAAMRAGTAGDWQIFTGHFCERHGLFVIIALGESLIAAGVTGSELGLSRGVLGVTLLAVLTTCALWWTYFGWAKDAIEESFRRLSGSVGAYARDVYSFAHFPIIAGVIGFAVAIEETIAHPGDPLAATGVVALVGGIALFLGGTYAAVRRAGVKSPPVRPATIAAMMVGAPALVLVPAWVALGLVGALVAVVAVAEQTRGEPAA